MAKVTAEQLRDSISQCIGTEAYHRLSIVPINCTDGVKAVAELAGAFWLVDAIGSYQTEPKIKAEEFQVWKLEVKGSTAVLYMTDGNSNQRKVEQLITYTDFPEGTWEFYLTDNVLMLTSEY